MAAFKVKSLWTVFITAFFAVLASLGLTAPAAAAGSAVQQSAGQPADHPADQSAPEARPVAPERGRGADAAPERAALSLPLPRERSLPPTIKQRICAEAHGSSPSVRRLPAGISADASTSAHSEAAAGAAATLVAA